MNFGCCFRWVLLLVSLGSIPGLAQPIITGFTPAAGTAGDQYILTGSGFATPGITVRFWQNAVVTVDFISSDSQMTVTVPSGISTGPISIQQGTGAPNFTANDFLAIGAGPYI